MNLESRILKESFGVLVLASIVSTIGGIGLETVQDKIIRVIPLLILFPALNGMIGNFGTVFASHYTTLYHQNKLGKKRSWNRALKRQFFMLLKISFLSGFYLSTLASLIGFLQGFRFNPEMYLKILIITLTTSTFLIVLIAGIVILAGNWFIKKKEDPDNLLIPITTSIADLGSMILFSILIFFLF